MQKTRRTIFTAVITVLFVLSVSYFALLAPTTAWYYQEDAQAFNYAFSFKRYNESFASQSLGTQEVQLRAATRFADSGEWLFDEVIHVVRISTTNNGTSGTDLTGLIKVKVTDNNNQPLNSGIRWFALACDTNNPITLPADFNAAAAYYQAVDQSQTYDGASGPYNGIKGPYKSAIETSLSNDFGVVLETFETATKTVNGNTVLKGEDAYVADSSDNETTYFETAVAALDAHNKEGFMVAPGESKYIYVVFWAEYGDLIGNSTNNHNSGILLRDANDKGTAWNTTYLANITIEARPFVGLYGVDATDKTLQFNNTTGGNVDVTLSTPGQPDVVYTILTDNTIRQGGNTPVESISLHADAQFRLKAATGYCFSGNSTGVLTGTNNTVCAVSQLTDNLTLSINTI